MTFDIWNRRYTGSKYKLSEWIVDLIHTNCSGKSFCDIFAGTAIMSKQMLNSVEEIYINDFLYSNELIYKAFFEQKGFSKNKLLKYKKIFDSLEPNDLAENYFSINFGNKFFSKNDAILIGYIRDYIQNIKDTIIHTIQKAVLQKTRSLFRILNKYSLKKDK